MNFARLLNAKMNQMNANQGDSREEERAYCKIRGLLGKSASEIKS